MAKSYNGLRSDAVVIKNEIEAGKNTAPRIGVMFVDIINKMQENSDSTVYLTQAEYDSLLADDKIDETVEYNIYEE